MSSMFSHSPSSCTPPKARVRARTRVLGTALGVGLGFAFASAEAEASEPTPSDYTLDAGKTRFGTPRLQWTTPPPLQLQPERARVSLLLPPEWMPEPTINRRGIHIPTTKDFQFSVMSKVHATATVGSRIHLHLSVPRQDLDFGLSISPRSWVAILRFDPITWTE